MKRFYLLAGIVLFVQLYGLGANEQTPQTQTQLEFIIKDGRITDTVTRLEFRQINSVAGTKDVIKANYGSEHVRMSPNGKFLLYNNYVIPLEDGEIIMLVDMPAFRSSWSPDGKKIVFYSNGIWLIPVSPETGRPTGPAQKILEGDYLYQAGPWWAPDSRKIGFWSTDHHLVVLSLVDGSVTQLTKEAQYYYKGQWSPDGKWIAFSQNRDSMWVIPSEGGQARKLTDTEGRAIPKWSPDGKWVFYQIDRKLHFVRFADGFTFDVTLPQEIGFHVSWSQDDKKMLFYKCSYESDDSLKIISSSGGEPFGPRGLILWAEYHHWSVDSKYILTWGKNNDKWIYWIVPMNGENAFPLRLDVPLEGDLNCGSISPDLKKICFSQEQTQGEKSIWVSPISIKQGKTVGLPVKIFDKGKVDQENIYWASDGSKLAFFDEENLWMARADGSEAVQLSGVSDGKVFRPCFSPDGSAVSWISYPREPEICILRIRRMSENESHEIARSSKYIYHQWSPYGRWIGYGFYDTKEELTHELFIFSPFDGESKKLLEGRIQRWAWSPSGERLAVLTKEKLLIFDVKDGKCQEIGEKIDALWKRCIDMKWSPDEREIALIKFFSPDSASQDNSSILTVSISDGKWTELTGRSAFSYSLSWSPDGRWISYDLEEFVKVRPEGILWEVDVESFLNKMDENNPESPKASQN
jgi:Tol biopolymer transport system component